MIPDNQNNPLPLKKVFFKTIEPRKPRTIGKAIKTSPEHGLSNWSVKGEAVLIINHITFDVKRFESRIERRALFANWNRKYQLPVRPWVMIIVKLD